MLSSSNSVDDILHGRIILNNLPPIKPRIIRLYLCAPFSDTIDEQNELYENVFPKLREFAMYRYGLEFQVINFHWGINEVQINNKYLLDYCLNEIKRAKECSIGPTFLGLLGDVYGDSILPLKIERVCYENIISCLQEKKVDYLLLQAYYRLNKNFLNNQYEFIIDVNLDGNVEKTLIETLKLACAFLKEKGIALDDQLKIFEDTVAKRLLECGAFNNNDKTNKVFTFVRVPSNNNSTDKTLEKIKDVTVNKEIPPEQIYRIRLNYSSKIDKDYKSYIKNFGDHYLKLFKNLIDKFVQQNPEYNYKNSYEDALYHYHYISGNLNDDLIAGGENAIKNIRDYIYDTTFRQPLILTGPMGSGKTSVLATLASTLHLQIIASQAKKHAKDAIIVRFIGADRKSMDLRSLLKSICLQLNAIFNDANAKIPDKFSELKVFLKNLLIKSQNENDENEPRLILILDSVQDLYENDYAHKLDWLPTYLKANCKIIISVSSESKNIIERLNIKYTNKRSYVSLINVDSDQAETLIQKYLSTNKYRLEDSQMQLIKKFISSSNLLSLQLKLFSTEFLNWKSYTPPESTIVESTLNAAIFRLFTNLEKKHGLLLVKYSLSYLTASRTGLSEMELQDILSLDDTLLRELKPKLKQPNNVLVVPFFYILPLIQDLQRHLVIRPDNGLYVIYWRHKLFADLVYQRYITPNKGFESQLHVNISEYYLGKWSGVTKPLEYEGLEEVKSTEFSYNTPRIAKFTLQTNRLTPKQPLQYDTFHTHIKPRLNLRKLTMLPYHLIKAGKIETLLNDVYFNIEWLYHKICAFDLSSLINDFELYKENSEVNLVRDALKMSESAILEDKEHLFIELTGRLLPYYDVYEKIRSLIKQCDQLSLKHHPIVPIRQTYKAPSWILQEEFTMGIQMNDNLQVDLLEHDFYGRILVAKNLNSTMAKFFDLDLMEMKNDIFIGNGIVYCNKSGKYACTIEENTKLIIKRIENGEFYNEVNFDYCEIGQVYLSNKYASITIRKAPSPMIIDLEQAKIIKTLPYQASFTCISPDDQVLLVHSEDKLNYHRLPDLTRLICLQSREIPEITIFSKSNSKLYCLSRRTKQVTFYNIFIEKRHYQALPILQDTDIFDMKISFDESMLLICSLQCLYVINNTSNTCELLYKLKPNLPSLISFQNDDTISTVSSTPTSSSVPSSAVGNKRTSNRNIFNGFGSTLNNQIIYATYYTYLFCWEAKTGNLLRIFQGTLAANRIIKSYSSTMTDSIVSLLDDGTLICWNLLNVGKNINFDDMALYSNPVANCLLPKINFNSSNSSFYAVSYSIASPDAKLHYLKDRFSVKNVLSVYYDEKIDNPLTARIESIYFDETGQYCFIVINLDDFQGKRIPEDLNFIKKVATLIDLKHDAIIIEKFSFIVRKHSRFELKAEFINKNINEIYLLIQVTSCINDFDPYTTTYDWTDFETIIKLYGPIALKIDDTTTDRLPLFDEFKLIGELLNKKLCITTKTFIYAALTHECHKMFDKDEPNEVKAKRYDTHLNLYELFENKKEKVPVQLFDINEFVDSDDSNSYKNIFLDIQTMTNGNLLIIYSKKGADVDESNKFFYNYDKFEFKRDFKTAKGGLVYDPKENNVLKRFPLFLNENTDVTRLVMSDNDLIIDNLWNIYGLGSGNLMYTIDKNNNYDLEYKWVRFLLNGRYIITTNKAHDKLYIVRCYDSKVVSSLWLHDKISCLNTGELDRTIVIGTKNGYLLCFKLLIDLEVHEVNEKYLKFFRYQSLDKLLDNLKQTESNESFTFLSFTNLSSYNENDDKHTKTNNSNRKPDIDDKFDSNTNNLSYDLRRMLNSAYEHKRLKSRESNQRSRSASVLSMQMTSTAENLFDNQHSGIIKRNLTNLATGIKYAPLNTTSAACSIQ